MAHAYTPGLKVSRYAHLERDRRLPLKGDVTVSKGDNVSADQVVARTELPGNVHMVNIAGILNVHQSDVQDTMIKREGDALEKGEIIATAKSLFGLFKSHCKSPIAGTLESVSTVTGQAVLREPPIPVEVNAYMDGVVTDVYESEGVLVECNGTFIQGIFGIGGEVSDTIKILAKDNNDTVTPERITPEMKDTILIVGRIASTELLERAAEVGVSALVAAGINAKDLKDFLGYDLGVAITGSERKGVTLITTEGFGPLPMADKTFALLGENEGKKASATGATQIRAGVMRPEIVIPAEEGTLDTVGEGVGLTEGSQIRVIREPYFGQLADVVDLPPELHAMESETKVRVLRAKLASGEVVTVPRANVEMIEE